MYQISLVFEGVVRVGVHVAEDSCERPIKHIILKFLFCFKDINTKTKKTARERGAGGGDGEERKERKEHKKRYI